MGEIRNVYMILVGIPEGKGQLRRPRRSWKDSVRMDRREVVWGGVDWIHLDEDMDQWRAVVNTIMKLRVP